MGIQVNDAIAKREMLLTELFTSLKLLQEIMNTLFSKDVYYTSLHAVQVKPNEVPVMVDEEVIDSVKLVENKTKGRMRIPNTLCSQNNTHPAVG